jgi:UDP-2,3-diacylglucosamine pyrophosphatase LpxH
LIGIIAQKVMIETYKKLKPEVVVAHEVPESVVDVILAKYNMTKFDIPSITRQFLQVMIEEHKPALVIHGHWHINHHTIVDGVEYVGLGELTAIDLDI